MDYRNVQKIAKDTIAYVRQNICSGMKLSEVRDMCETKMLELGADSFWYWDVGAFVFSGDETAVSISGRDYKTSDRIIGMNDIVTIDLSPQCGDTWGDFARTIILQDGKAVKTEYVRESEWKNGLLMEKFLHEELFGFAEKDTTFEELFYYMNDLIAKKGFVNRDFCGYLGHSIEKHKDDRIYIERGNHSLLSDAAYFTFEPHIGLPGSVYGFKRENIYYFENGVLKEL